MSVLKNIRKAIARQFSVSDKAEALTHGAQENGKQSVYNDGGQFSPSNPITPNHQGFAPWQYQYSVGENINFQPRSERGSLLPFRVLRDVASNHDITALCIKMMIDQVCGDSWDIVVADKNDRNHYEEDVKKVKEFFHRPDKVHLFTDWLKPILYDSLSIDAATIYKHRTRGGKLYSLEYVDGSTIKPLIDTYGRVPQPPYAAYQQVVYGYPYGSSEKKEAKTLGFTLDEISYRPRYPRTFSRYGVSPIETILMKINIALRRDTVNLNYYTDGTTPDGGIFTFDKADMTPDEIQQFATLYNDIMAGRLKERFKLKFLPKGTYTQTKEHKFDIEYEEWMARIVAIAFGVNPQQFIMMMNRSTGQLQDEQQTELGLAPLENFLSEWFSDIIQNDLGYHHLKFSYIGEKREDAAMSIRRDVDFVQSGILTIDEVRSQRGMPPITGLKDGTPPMVKVGNDVILLTEEYIKAKTQAQIEALQYGNVQAGNQSDIENKIREAREDEQEGSQDDEGTEPKEEPVTDKENAHKAAQDELRLFHKYVMNRLKKKTRGKRKFEVTLLPKEMRDNIYAKLDKADTTEEVDSIFEEASQGLEYQQNLEDAEDELNNLFADITKYIMDNLEGLTEEDFNRSGTAKKYLLLLLLLGGYDLKAKFDDVMEDILKRYGTSIMQSMNRCLARMGDKLTPNQRKRMVDAYMKDRMAFLSDELNRVTEEKLGNMFMQAESVEDVLEGLDVNYALTVGRAQNIAVTEYHTAQTILAIQTAKSVDDVKAVYVTDGIQWDMACINANGSVWSIEHAEANPLEHPRCHRLFWPISQEDIDAHGGIDEE